MVDAVVNNTPQALQKFTARIAEMIPGGVVPDLLRERDRGGTEETVAAGFRLLVHNQLSFISTVNTLFSNFARPGERAASEVGNPTCRRRVPICTTSSSPFLNRPTSPFAAKGSCRRTS